MIDRLLVSFTDRQVRHKRSMSDSCLLHQGPVQHILVEHHVKTLGQNIYYVSQRRGPSADLWAEYTWWHSFHGRVDCVISIRMRKKSIRHVHPFATKVSSETFPCRGFLLPAATPELVRMFPSWVYLECWYTDDSPHIFICECERWDFTSARTYTLRPT